MTKHTNSLRFAVAALLLLFSASAASAQDQPRRLVEASSQVLARGNNTTSFTTPTPTGRWWVTVERQSGNARARVSLNGAVVLRPSGLSGSFASARVQVQATNALNVRVTGQGSVRVKIEGVVREDRLSPVVGRRVGLVMLYRKSFTASGWIGFVSEQATVTSPTTDGIFELVTRNGTASGDQRFLFGAVSWNQTLASFVQRRTHLERVRVAVAPSNSLQLTAIGRSGSRLRVRVRGWLVDETAPTVSFVSPQPGSTPGPTDWIQISFSDSVSGIQPDSLKLLLNGTDVTSAFQVTASGATATLSDLPSGVLQPGNNTLVAAIKDKALNEGTASLAFNQGSGNAPTIAHPGDLTRECTGSTGARVAFTVTADAGATVSCSPASGSVFPVGTTTVTCTATAPSGQSQATFQVVVRDTRAPFLGQTQLATQPEVPIAGVSPGPLVVGDLNGDGQPDVVVASTSAPTLTVYLNQSGQLVAQPPVALPQIASALALGDLNGDTRLDLVSTLASSDQVAILLGTPAGSFGTPTTVAVGDDPQDLALADLDRDGDLDLVSADRGSSTLSILLGDGAGGFGARQGLPTQAAPETVLATDLNVDGQVDLVAGSGSSVSIHLGTSSGPGAPTTVATGSGVRKLQAGDMNGDGWPDLATANFTSNTLTLLLSSGPGVFTVSSLATSTGPLDLVLADLDADGDLDVVALASTGQRASSFLNAGAGTFGAPSNAVTGAAGRSLALADLDGDGRSDYVSTQAGGLGVLLGDPGLTSLTAEATGPNGAAISYSPPAARDACDPSPALVSSPAPGSTFALGASTVTCTATDGAGNSSKVTFTATVTDTTGPAFGPLPDLTVEQASSAGSVVNYAAPAADLVDPNPTVVCVPASGTVFPAGTTTVTCTATDSAGNQTVRTFTVSVQDTTAPALPQLGNLTIEQSSPTGATVTYQVPVATDAVDPSPTIVCAPPSGSAFAPGVTPVTCTATDAAGNSSTVTFSVNVVDTIPPTLTQPAGLTVEQSSPAGAVVSYSAPTASDVADPSPSVVCIPASGTTFAAGTTTVTCTATDAAGNSSSVSFTVTVQDTTAPTLAQAPNLTVEQAGATGTVVAYAAPSATDTVDANPSVVCTPASGSLFAAGVTLVTCTATDAAGNVATTSFTVTVQDTTAPSIAQPANLTVLATGPAGAVVNYATPAVTDVVDPAPAVVCSPASGTTFPLGATTVTCTATDAAGNVGSVSFSVTVTQDTTPPTLTQPANLTVEQASAAGTVVTYAAPVAVDAIDPNPTVVCVPASGTTFPAGVTTVTCTATDASGNAASVTFTVTVQDTTAPTLAQPANLSVPATGPTGAVVIYTNPTATDAVDPNPSVVCTPASGSTFSIGVTTVVCTATDAAGNASSATFTVTVFADTTAPVLVQPPNLTVEQASPAGTVVAFTNPTATDDTDPNPAVVCAPPSGSTFAAGTATVVCTATDAAGNSASVSFTVTVQDTTPPALAQPADLTVPQTSPAGAVVTFPTPTVTDAADPAPAVTCVPASGSTFPVGTTAVVCTATDAAGNAGSVTFSVTVQGSQGPPLNVTSVAPPSGSLDLFVDEKSFTVCFDQAIDTATANNSTILLIENGVGTVSSASIAATSTKAVLSLAGNLSPNANYTLQVTTGVMSTTGGTLSTAYTANYSTNSLVSVADDDMDGLTNLEERAFGTNPLEADSDSDGLDDYVEIYVERTDPTNPDTDKDGELDGADGEPRGAPDEVTKDGGIGGAELISGDAFGPLRGGLKFLIKLPQPTPGRQLTGLELRIPEFAEFGHTEVLAVLGKFETNHDLFYAQVDTPDAPKLKDHYGLAPEVVQLKFQYHTGGGNDRIDALAPGWSVGSPLFFRVDTQDVPQVRKILPFAETGTFYPALLKYVDTQNPANNLTYTLGDFVVHGVIVGTGLSFDGYEDQRSFDGNGARVEVRDGGTLLGRKTMRATETGYGFPDHPIRESVSHQGLTVNPGTGELFHGVSLFDCAGPGISLGMGLSYRSSASGFWAATAGLEHRDEQVHAPFGHGWNSVYSMRILIRKSDTRQFVSGQPVITEVESYAFQSASGKSYEINFGTGTGKMASFVDEALPLFGVPASLVEVKKLPSGQFEIGADRSATKITFDSSGRLTEIRRRDHGRPLTLTYSSGSVVIKDSQGREMTWALDSEERVVEVRDPKGRVWDLTYEGHSLMSVAQRGSISYCFGYSAKTHHMTHATSPSGLVTKIAYRDPVAEPDTGFVSSFRPQLPAYTVKSVAEHTAAMVLSFQRTSNNHHFELTIDDVLQRTTTHITQWSFNNGGSVEVKSQKGDWTRLLTLTNTTSEVRSPNPGLPTTTTYSVLGSGNHQVDTTLRSGFPTLLKLNDSGFWPELSASIQSPVVTFSATTKTNGQGIQSVGLIQSSSWTGQAGVATTKYTHNNDGELLQVEDPRGVVTAMTRSNADNEVGLVVKRVTSKDGKSVEESFVHDAMGNVTDHYDSAQVRTETRYTVLDQVEKVIAASGAAVTNSFDSAGRLVSVTSNQGGTTTYEYNAFDQVVRTTVSGVGVTTYERNQLGEVTRVNGPRHEGTNTDFVTYKHDGRGLVKEVTRGASHAGESSPVIARTVLLDRDPRGNVTKSTRQEGGTNYETNTVYSRLDSPIETQLPSLTVGAATFRPRITTLRDFNDRVWRVEQEVRPNDGGPDKEVLLDRDFNAASQVTKVRSGKPTSIRAESEPVYDIAGNLIAMKGADFNVGGPADPARPSGSVDLDELGRVVRNRDAAGKVLREVVYDGTKGRITQVKRPNSGGVLQTVEWREYDNIGRVSQIRSFHGGKRFLFYDSVGRLRRTEIKDRFDNLITIEETTYDPVGRPVQIQMRDRDQSPTVVRTKKITYTARGDVETETQVVGGNEFTTRYEYGAGGRVTKVTNPLGDSTIMTYDTKGRLLTRQSPRGVTLTYEYDDWDRVSKVTGPTETVETKYDAANRIVQQFNALYSRSFEYDELGRRVKVHTTDIIAGKTRTFTYTYDPAVHRYGGVTKVTDQEGLATDYEYDQELRVKKITQTPTVGSPTEVASFEYDTLGRTKRWTNPAGSWNRDYDAAGLTVSQSSSSPNHSIVWGHDDFGRRKTATYGHLNNLRFTWNYDGVQRMNEEVVTRANGTPVYRDQFTYTEADNRATRIRNGVLSTYNHDGWNRLTSVETSTLQPVTSGLTATADSQLDGNHGVGLVLDGTASTESGDGQAFVSGTADADHYLEITAGSELAVNGVVLHLPTDVSFPQRLYLQYHDGTDWKPVPLLSLQGGDLSFTNGEQDGFTPTQAQVTLSFNSLPTSRIRILQPAGAGPTLPSTHGSALAISEIQLQRAVSSTKSFTYDKNGNMLTAGSRVHTYDDRDRLSSIVDGTDLNMTFDYAPNGQLMRQTDSIAGTDDHHLYMGAELYAKYGTDGVLTSRYIHGPGLDRKIGVVPYAGGAAQKASYFYSTPNGSVHKVVQWDPNGGGQGTSTLLDTTVQSAFGEPILKGLVSSAENPATEFGYTGRRRLGNSGLYDYRNRIYDPALGRFLTPDPLGTAAGMNLYGYVSGDPVNKSDPFGLEEYPADFVGPLQRGDTRSPYTRVQRALLQAYDQIRAERQAADSRWFEDYIHMVGAKLAAKRRAEAAMNAQSMRKKLKHLVFSTVVDVGLIGTGMWIAHASRVAGAAAFIVGVGATQPGHGKDPRTPGQRSAADVVGTLGLGAFPFRSPLPEIRRGGQFARGLAQDLRAAVIRTGPVAPTNVASAVWAPRAGLLSDLAKNFANARDIRALIQRAEAILRTEVALAAAPHRSATRIGAIAGRNAAPQIVAHAERLGIHATAEARVALPLAESNLIVFADDATLANFRVADIMLHNERIVLELTMESSHSVSKLSLHKQGQLADYYMGGFEPILITPR